ncbi:MAG TPA: Crp/Fnr family transcriptional regulator [Actinophytocola sp.]|jgi:CRP-like cAMP-binding protein|nr:Crp/Fnr family transcriptional regulator [Actinophytocola sp.]
MREWPESTLLGGLNEAERSMILTVGTEVPYRDGKRLITQGSDDDHAYLMLRGMVKVAVRDHNGRSALLGIRLAGDLVGEMGALDGPPRSADVTASGDILVRVIRAPDLRELSRRKPDIALGITRMIAGRLRWANQRRLDFTARDPRARVARILYEVVRAYGSFRRTHWELGVELTQSEIASLAATALRTMEKELRRLQDEGVLVRRYRDIHVVDLDLLKQIAEV